MKKTISSVLKEIGSLPTQKEKVEALQRIGSPAVRQLLRLAIDPDLVWLLPESPPPYVPNKELDDGGILYAEMRRMYLFLKDGHPNLKQSRREQLFVHLLNNLPPDDAELMLIVKDKKLPAGLTPAIVKKAFPDILMSLA